MMNRLALALLPLLLAACSSASESSSDAGGAETNSTLSDVSQANDGVSDAPMEAPRADGGAFDGGTADTPPDEDHSDGREADRASAEDRPGGSAADASSGEDVPSGSVADTSTRDAPPDESPPDGSPGDASSRDEASLSCDQTTHDPLLGTAKLGPSYRVVDWAVLPVTSWLPIALVGETLADGSIGQVVYGYAGDGLVHRLGVWPQLAAPDMTNVAFDAILPSDRTLQIVTTPLLVGAGGQLLAGYRTLRSGAFVGGAVSIYDTAHPEAGARRIAAVGMESALGLGGYFLVGGDGVGSAVGGRGVYGISTQDVSAPLAVVAKYPVYAGENVRPGPMAVTSGGLVVIGHYLDLAERNSLRMPEPSQLGEALSGGLPIDLASTPELTPADDVANFSSLGQGVAVLHTHKVRGILPALGRLDHYTLSREGKDAGTAVGAPVTMLSSSDDDGCTAVSQLVPVAGGLTIVVGLWDRNGQRLLRLAPL